MATNKFEKCAPTGGILNMEFKLKDSITFSIVVDIGTEMESIDYPNEKELKCDVKDKKFSIVIIDQNDNKIKLSIIGDFLIEDEEISNILNNCSLYFTIFKDTKDTFQIRLCNQEGTEIISFYNCELSQISDTNLFSIINVNIVSSSSLTAQFVSGTFKPHPIAHNP